MEIIIWKCLLLKYSFFSNYKNTRIELSFWNIFYLKSTCHFRSLYYCIIFVMKILLWMDHRRMYVFSAISIMINRTDLRNGSSNFKIFSPLAWSCSWGGHTRYKLQATRNDHSAGRCSWPGSGNRVPAARRIWTLIESRAILLASRSKAGPTSYQMQCLFCYLSRLKWVVWTANPDDANPQPDESPW